VSVARRLILAAATNGTARRVVGRYGMRLGAARFVAGETLDECVTVLRRLNDRGLWANTTILGEGVADAAEALSVADEYELVLERIAAERLRANVALKLTHLGLDLDEELAFANVARVVDTAARLDNFVRIDMEHSSNVDATLRIYRRLRETARDNVGTVLQSYLHRTEDDLRSLLPLRPNLRIVKGAYLEPESVAYPAKADVDASFARLVATLMRAGCYTCVATHDERLIEWAIDLARREGVTSDRFEFQLLYGVRSNLQLELLRRGFKVLVATPFGPDWYPYLMRRLAERPANVAFLARSLVRG
jgi:proline dehydrogenase